MILVLTGNFFFSISEKKIPHFSPVLFIPKKKEKEFAAAKVAIIGKNEREE